MRSIACDHRRLFEGTKWSTKTAQFIINRYYLKNGDSIDAHTDDHPVYSSDLPIVSLSFGKGALFEVVSSMKAAKAVHSCIWMPPYSALIMWGTFQKRQGLSVTTNMSPLSCNLHQKQ